MKPSSVMKLRKAGGGTPVLVTSATSTQTSDTTSHPINMPSGIVAGNSLLLTFSVDTGTLPATPAGWTVVDSQVAPSSAFYSIIFKKTAEGGDTVTVTTVGAERSAAICMRISPATHMYVSKTTQGDTTSPDCPSLSPGVGINSFLWLACYASSADNTVTAPPSGYTTVAAVNSTSATNGVSCSVCQKTSTASSEDPGTATSGPTGRSQVLMTLGIRDA